MCPGTGACKKSEIPYFIISTYFKLPVKGMGCYWPIVKLSHCLASNVRCIRIASLAVYVPAKKENYCPIISTYVKLPMHARHEALLA